MGRISKGRRRYLLESVASYDFIMRMAIAEQRKHVIPLRQPPEYISRPGLVVLDIDWASFGFNGGR